MSGTLILLNDPPYGTERSYNGLRLALALPKADPEARVHVFLMADAVACARTGQQTPNGYYNLERMLRAVLRHGDVLLCGSCMDARGLQEADLVEGARRSSMEELARRTLAADKVLVF
ncbi:MAG TPA: DsrE family protein [Thermoanaerobaculia bacterium]|nr:DsrE family protein [Thermoanaerobaculia bacterium]